MLVLATCSLASPLHPRGDTGLEVAKIPSETLAPLNPTLDTTGLVEKDEASLKFEKTRYAVAVASSKSLTDHLLFSTPLKEFIERRKKALNNTPVGVADSRLDWASDGCSSSPDKPFGFNFLDACYRHDFGYRNLKLQRRFTEPARKKVDENFLKDTTAMCKKESAAKRPVCQKLAETYFGAVRKWGASARDEGEKNIRAELDKFVDRVHGIEKRLKYNITEDKRWQGGKESRSMSTAEEIFYLGVVPVLITFMMAW